MGMTIDEIIENLITIRNKLCSRKYETESALTFDGAIDTMHKYQKLQADYETRLKTDLAAMLTELQLEIEEIDSRPGYGGNGMPTFTNDYVRIIKVNEIIQQKINSLKENKDAV